MENKHRFKLVVLITVFSCMVVALGFIGKTLYSTAHTFSVSNNGYIGRYKPVIVISGSMEPSIMTNSLSLAENCSIEDVKLNDVVLYNSRQAGVVSHRVIDIDNINGEIYLMTKGDANPEADGFLINEDNFEGRIIYTLNSVAPLITFFNTDNNIPATMYRMIIALIMIICVIIITWKPFTKYMKAIWILNKHSRFDKKIKKLNELAVYQENVHKIKSRLDLIDSNVGNVIMAYHLGKALESIEDIEDSIEDLEKRVTKMYKHIK